MTFQGAASFLGVNTKATRHAHHVGKMYILGGPRNYGSQSLKKVNNGYIGTILIDSTPMPSTSMAKRSFKIGQKLQQVHRL